MAPTAAKISLTLRKEVDGNAGARVMGPKAGRRQKSKESLVGYRIFHNLPHPNPMGNRTRGKGQADAATASPTITPIKALGKKADVIPLDEETSESKSKKPSEKPAAMGCDARYETAVKTKAEEGLSIAPRVIKSNSGMTQPRGGAAGGTSPLSKLHDNEEVESSLKPSTRLPAAAASARASRQGKGGSSISHADKSNAGNAMDDGKDNSKDKSEPNELGFGMQELYKWMVVPGTSATRFAAAASQTYSSQKDWADKLGSFVAGLRVEDSALKTALAPAAAGQTYLAIIGGSETFFVLHGLQQWPKSQRSRVNDGQIVAFEGKTVQDNQPPDVWRFERSDEDLFNLKGFEEIEPLPVSKFYCTMDAHNDMFFAEVRRGDEGLWVGSLIPIPMMWAPLFLDYPNMGTTYRQVEDLV
jgi:hypothetical protein